MEFLSADKSFRADSEVKGAPRCGLVGFFGNVMGNFRLWRGLVSGS